MDFERDAYNKPEQGEAQPRVVITKVKGTDGIERWVVNIPGTEQSRPLGPTGFDTDVATLASARNASEQSALSRAIVAAMDRAGVDDSGLDVMLSGHSLGGMVAADIASDPDLVDRFHIKAITTQGSPIAHYPVDPDVDVLAFEHNQDPIPQLDGADNPHRTNWTTVQTNVHTGSADPMSPHGQGTYRDSMVGAPDDHGQRSGGYQVASTSAVQAFLGTGVEAQWTSRLEEK
jgi:pimeloyl-ACP methyl ester carboxylesterase